MLKDNFTQSSLRIGKANNHEEAVHPGRHTDPAEGPTRPNSSTRKGGKRIQQTNISEKCFKTAKVFRQTIYQSACDNSEARPNSKTGDRLKEN